jgi:hypothetical protein
LHPHIHAILFLLDYQEQALALGRTFPEFANSPAFLGYGAQLLKQFGRLQKRQNAACCLAACGADNILGYNLRQESRQQALTMFDKLRNAVFWTDKFDEAWRHNSMFLKLPDVSWRWDKRIAEKKAYWREHGKKRQLSPRQAVFRAFEDIADTLYLEHPDKDRMQTTWLELAYAQYYAAATADWDGPWVPPEQRLAERWQPYYATYHSKREADKQDKEQRAKEIQSYRFERKEIDTAWNRLMDGDVSRDLQAMWLHSGPPRKPAHQIASRAKMSMRDFVFWMVVLREQGFMSEEVVLDEHLYCNQRSWLEGRDNLDKGRKDLLDRLAGR